MQARRPDGPSHDVLAPPSPGRWRDLGYTAVRAAGKEGVRDERAGKWLVNDGVTHGLAKSRDYTFVMDEHVFEHVCGKYTVEREKSFIIYFPDECDFGHK